MTEPTDTPDELMELIKDIMDAGDITLSGGMTPAEATAAITKLILDVIIGEDDKYNEAERGYAVAYGGQFSDGNRKKWRNALRAEQRNRLGKL